MIEARVTNADDIKLEIKIELSIGEWRELKKRIGSAHGAQDGIGWYDPINDFLLGIRDAISMVEERARIHHIVPGQSPEAR